jgi:hypothetical protein
MLLPLQHNFVWLCIPQCMMCVITHVINKFSTYAKLADKQDISHETS